VQRLPSSQLGATPAEQVPVVGLQVSTPLQGLPSSHSGGPGTQVELTQVSTPSQGSPSSHCALLVQSSDGQVVAIAVSLRGASGWARATTLGAALGRSTFHISCRNHSTTPEIRQRLKLRPRRQFVSQHLHDATPRGFNLSDTSLGQR